MRSSRPDPYETQAPANCTTFRNLGMSRTDGSSGAPPFAGSGRMEGGNITTLTRDTQSGKAGRQALVYPDLLRGSCGGC